jgi:hypothetical protein
MRALNPARFEDMVVGRLPDAGAGGPHAGGRAMALDSVVNATIGGYVGGKPVGYRDSAVRVVRPPGGRRRW